MSPPLRQYLESQGYQVNCEVNHCDMTAVKGEDVLIIELKLRMSLRFLYQCLNRTRITDSVYLALPVSGGQEMPPEFAHLKSLLKRLEMGLILVRFLKTKTRVDVIQHPDQWEPIKRPGKRRSILREVNARSNEFNLAGSVGNQPKITAYRERALEIASCMEDGMIWTPVQLRKIGCDESVSQILRMNHYGWFIREDRGKYRLDSGGLEALKTWRYVLNKKA